MQTTTIDRRLFSVLLVAAILAQMAALPYVFSLFDASELPPVPLPVAVALSIVQGAIMAGIAILLGLLMASRVGLGVPFLQGWLHGQFDRAQFARTARSAVLLGVLVGAAIFVMDRFLFALLVEPITALQEGPALWQRVLVSFYGGISEEIFLRLFLMTLLVWLWWRCAGRRTPTPVVMWTAIMVVSILFGLGHLPMTARLMPLTFIVVVRAIVLNGIAGTLFGWLYWRKGLEAAMIAHFATDIALHVLLPVVA